MAVMAIRFEIFSACVCLEWGTVQIRCLSKLSYLLKFVLIQIYTMSSKSLEDIYKNLIKINKKKFRSTDLPKNEHLCFNIFHNPVLQLIYESQQDIYF